MDENHPDVPFKLPEVYFTGNLGVQTSSPEPGRTVAEIKVQPQHLNVAGAVHGGFFMTVLDTLMGHAVYTSLGDSAARFATSSMTTHFLEAIRAGTLTGEGRVVKKGELYVAAEAELRDAEGRLAATAEAIFTILRPEG